MTTGTSAFPSSVCAAILLFQPLYCFAERGVIEQGYDGFTVWFDCALRGAVRFEYKATHDSGSLSGKHSSSLDPDFPAECQQTSGDAYRC